MSQKTMLGREGRPVQNKQGAGKRQRGAGPEGNGGSLSIVHTSRVLD